MDDLCEGLILENRYKLIKQLGEGGFAVVWEVVDLEAKDAPKAIKVCKKQDTERFRVEFNDLKDLKSDYIVTVESIYPQKKPKPDHFFDGLTFFVMEKVEGNTIKELIEKSLKHSTKTKHQFLSFWQASYQMLFNRYPPLQSNVSYVQIANWLEQIAEVLEYLHLEGYIYSDLKPSNIMVMPDDNIKLIDFGALNYTSNPLPSPIFTHEYAAPEQKNGQARLQSDFYSFGYTILFALTGRHPLKLQQNWQSQIPVELRNFLSKAIQEDFLKRHTDANSLVKEAKQVAQSLRCQYGRWAVAKQMAVVMGIAAIATAITLGLRSTGILQTLEFAAYDRMLAMRPNSQQESPVLIIAIKDKQDISDQDLANVITNSLPDNPDDHPSLIHIGIKRDNRVDHTGQSSLESLFKKYPNIFGSCEYSSKDDKGFNFIPKPVTPLGFGNTLSYHSKDEVRRIHLLMYKNIPQDLCRTDVSISLLLANYYLYKSYANLNPTQIINSNEYIFGKAKFHNLEIGQAAYQERGKNSFNGYFQILLDYHSFKLPQKEAFADVLKTKLPAKKVKGKIVLIGRNDYDLSESDRKDLIQLTPYGAMSAIEWRSQMISHLISVARGERPVLHPASFGLDLFWILTITTLSGFFCWRISNSTGRVVLIIALPIALYAGCFMLLLTQGLWLGFVPIAIASTSANVAIFLCFRQKVFNYF
ncbi:MAG: protein kinase domain-containing protein [Pseudanabaenaceae cyanobacterium]|jgi:CHASE2 domain-containing sensor protein